ncbi:diguanylate cyclase [Thalassotalea ganghwensis]
MRIFLLYSVLVTALSSGDVLARAQTVTYCVDPDWAPYESIVDGQHQGISKLFLALIEQKSPLTFQLVPTQNWQQTLDYAKQGLCDILPMLNSSEERQKFLSFSNDYFRAPNVLYGHYDQPIIGNLSGLSSQTIAVVSGYRLHQHLLDNFAGANIVAVSNGLEGLKLANNKKVDYFVGSFHSSNRLIEQHNLSDIRITGIATLEDQLRIGVGKGKEHLLPIINQAIEKITPEERVEIFNFLKSIKIVERANYKAAMQVALVFLIITALLTFRYVKLSIYGKLLSQKNKVLEQLHSELDSKNKQLTELAMRDPLTKLFNRAHLSTIIDQQLKLVSRYDKDACMLMIDVDDFKKINDRFGHEHGDQVLIEIANTLSAIARDTDTVARWGGEEFVVICPESTIEQANNLAKRFQNALKVAATEKVNNITCSIGIAKLDNDSSASDWFKRADQAMYQAKSTGKNSIQLM